MKTQNSYLLKLKLLIAAWLLVSNYSYSQIVDSSIFFHVEFHADSMYKIIWDKIPNGSIYTVERSQDGSSFSVASTAQIDTLNDINGDTVHENEVFNRIHYSTEGGYQRFLFNELSSADSYTYRIKIVKNNGAVIYTQNNINRSDTTGLNSFVENLRSTSAGCPPVGVPPPGYSATNNVQYSYVNCCIIGTRQYISNTGCTPTNLPCAPGTVDCNCQCRYDPCCQHLCIEFAICTCGPWAICGSATIWVVDNVNALAINVSLQSQLNVSCFNGNNGNASVTATGGTGTLHYSWSPTGGSAATATGLTAGTYTCTVTDASGCSGSTTVTITQPPQIYVSLMGRTNASCAAATNGSLTIAVSGGVAPITYLWSPSGGTSATAINLGPGYYTCVITDHNGCTKTIGLDVFTNPPPTVSISANPSIISPCNPQVALTASNGFTSYLWSPTGLSSQVINVNQAGLNQVIATDANGCTASSSINVSQAEKPIIVGEYIACVDDAGSPYLYTYTISNWNLNFNYSWSAPGALTLTPGPTTQSVTITWPASLPSHPDPSGVINVTLSLPNCTTTVSYQVLACCRVNHPYENIYNGSSSILYPSGNLSIPGKIVINGNFIIDNHLIIGNCPDVELGPLARITIMPGASLTLNNDDLDSRCDYMWDGIYINGNGALNVINTTSIQHAISTINCFEEGSVFIDNSTFNHNFVNVNLRGANLSCQITSSNFNSSTILLNPHYNDRTFMHIHLDNIPNIRIGSGLTNRNYFENADYGIYSYNSTVSLDNNWFSGFYPTSGSAKDASAVRAIQSVGIDESVLNMIRIGTDYSNTFVNCFKGVFVSKQSAIIEHNSFGNVSQAIAIASGQQNYGFINDNSIAETDLAINCQNNWFANLEIVNNVIQSRNRPGLGYMIKATSPNSAISGGLNVHTNAIASYGSGILVQNYSKPQVVMNDILILGNPTIGYGIRSEGSTEPYVSCNNIDGISTAALLNKTGISLSFTKNGIIDCNSTNKVYTGMEFISDCLPTTVQGNSFKYLSEGLALGAGGTPGIIGPVHYSTNVTTTTANMFEGTNGAGSFPIAATHCKNSFGGPLYVSSGSIYVPNGNLWTGSFSAPFSPMSVPNNPYECNDDCLNFLNNTGHRDFDTSLAEMIAQDSSLVQNNPLIQWFIERGLYEQLLNDPAMMYNNSELTEFYDALQETNLAHLAEIHYALDYFTDLSFDELANIPKDELAAILVHVREMNNQIQPETIYEENEQKVNNIFLNTLGQQKTDIDEETANELLEIANQCPYIGGMAVYSARSLYSMINDSIVFYDKVICNSLTLRLAYSEMPKYIINSYPNPVKKDLIIDYDLSNFVNVKFMMFDAMGRRLMEMRINVRENQAIINTEKFSSGIYMYKIFGDDILLKSEKISIIKE